MILNYIKKIWELLNTISPSSRNFIILILLGFIFYNQIGVQIRENVIEEIKTDLALNKKAEQYTKESAIEINRQIKLIADKDQEAFDVLLLSYHNSTQSLQGYKYLYLSCIAEAPKELDTPLLKNQWNKIDYIYYADELEKIHNQSFVQIKNLEQVRHSLPKLYHLVKASDAEAIAFYAIEGVDSPIGMIVILYRGPKEYTPSYQKVVIPSIQKLAILLDYENIKK